MAKRHRPVRPWVRLIPLAVLIFFLVAAFIYREGLEARASVGEAAPDFTLQRLNGETVSLSDFRGRPVIINFWTTWCRECRIEAPELEAFYREHGDRVALLGINMREPAAVVRPFVDEFALTYPILLDRDESIAKTYRVTGVPETWFIDAEGIARLRHVGPLDARGLEDGLEMLENPAQPAPPGGGRL